jgi:F0F1-type ATP synthase assembly protein I
MAAQMSNQARRVVVLQLLITAALALVLWGWQGPVAAVSWFMGGAIGFVPAWLYVWLMQAGGGNDPRQLLKAQYKAEFYKFAVTALLFALTFILFRDVSAPLLFLAYFATLAVYWVALVMP